MSAKTAPKIAINSKDEILKFLSSQKKRLFAVGVTELGLFGSYAKGSDDAFSDIDIAIETDGAKRVKNLGNPFSALVFLDDFKKKLSSKFNTNVDLCDTTSLSREEKTKLLQGAIYV